MTSLTHKIDSFCALIARRSLPSAENADHSAGCSQGERQIGITTLLGIGAAFFAIGRTVWYSTLELTTALGFLLTLTCLLALVGMRTRTHTSNMFLANIAAWIGAGAYLAAHSPATGLFVIAIASTAAYWVQTEEHLPSTDSKTATGDYTPSDIFAQDVDNLIASDGVARSEMQLSGVKISNGEKLTDRIHLNDRVPFLRALSAINSGQTETETVKVLLNSASSKQVARFQSVVFEMRRHESGTVKLIPIDDGSHHKPETVPEGKKQDANVLAIVSHELRTPLNAIIGFSDVLRNDSDQRLSVQNRAEYADLINAAGHHLLSLVNTILDVSKLESGAYTIHPDSFCFSQTAQECVSMVREQAKLKDIQINERLLPINQEIFADRRAVKQILINLLSNAVKYTSDGGFITIDAHIHRGELTFEVSDTGVGMDQSALSQIGKPFTQVDSSINRKSEGTGLGLSLVKGLIDLHGGKLEIDSKVGVGTRVVVTLPNEARAADSTNYAQAEATKVTALQPKTATDKIVLSNKEISRDERKTG